MLLLCGLQNKQKNCCKNPIGQTNGNSNKESNMQMCEFFVFCMDAKGDDGNSDRIIDSGECMN